MEVKKTERANIEKNKTTFTLVGLVITLALVWFAFEYKTYDRTVVELQQTAMLDDEEDVVLQTERAEPPPPPPPPQQTTVIEIVEDDIDVDDDLEIDAETDDEEEIEEQIIEDDDEGEDKEEEIFVFVEDQPGYPGGDEARLKYLRDNIKYPEMAKESGIQGTVYVTFVVEKDGRISNVKILRGIGGGCDEEAMRVIKGMPKWKPGKQRGRPVRAQFNMPIRFILQG
ncbi:MAG: energy transducer TonB [Bacteroidetes bacterium]|nr:MAG: energy transducer TonB [Bacteroidota bacterium]